MGSGKYFIAKNLFPTTSPLYAATGEWDIDDITETAYSYSSNPAMYPYTIANFYTDSTSNNTSNIGYTKCFANAYSATNTPTFPAVFYSKYSSTDIPWKPAIKGCRPKGNNINGNGTPANISNKFLYEATSGGFFIYRTDTSIKISSAASGGGTTIATYSASSFPGNCIPRQLLVVMQGGGGGGASSHGSQSGAGGGGGGCVVFILDFSTYNNFYFSVASGGSRGSYKSTSSQNPGSGGGDTFMQFIQSDGTAYTSSVFLLSAKGGGGGGAATGGTAGSWGLTDTRSLAQYFLVGNTYGGYSGGRGSDRTSSSNAGSVSAHDYTFFSPNYNSAYIFTNGYSTDMANDTTKLGHFVTSSFSGGSNNWSAGGGGASAFANGPNASGSGSVGHDGSLGSGGSSAPYVLFDGKAGGNGGNGFVRLYY